MYKPLEGISAIAVISITDGIIDRPLDGVTAIAVILIASFGIDRIVTGLLFLLSFIKAWDRLFPHPDRIQDVIKRTNAQRKHKLIYFVIAGILGGIVVAFFGEVRIFRAIGFNKINYILDSIITGLILMAGADRISEILKLMPSGAIGAKTTESRPIEITGRIILEDEKAKQIAKEQKS